MKKVLIIEDDEVLRENISELLEIAGYSVLSAENGRAGIEMAIKNSPDIILCDIIMPELNGYEVLEKLNKRKVTNRIPFIFLTAKSDQREIRRGMNLGADDYITKPFLEEDLLKSIESRLSRFKLVKELKDQKPLSPHEDTMHTLYDLKNYIIQHGTFLKFEKKQLLFSEGEKCNHTFLLNKGVVKTHIMDEWGKELIIDIFQKGQLLGYSFFTSSRYEETATTMEGGSAYKFSNVQLRDILVRNPVLTLELAELLSDNCSALKSHLLETAYSGVLRKTTHTIVQIAKKMKIKTGDSITISRCDMARVAGISTESFIRSIAILKQDHLIGLSGKKLKILDLEKLEKIG